MNRNTLYFLDEHPAAGAPTDRTILLIHGSASSSRQWTAFLATRQPDERVIAPDLPGYGRSPFDTGLTVQEQDLSALTSLIEQMHGKRTVDLVGHSYGGALALDFAASHQDRLRSLTLIEPAAFNILRASGDPAWKDIENLSREHIRLVDAGAPEAAAELFMHYWIGETAWNAITGPRRETVIGLMPRVAAEWRWMWQNDTSPGRLLTLEVPTRLIVGTETTAAARRTLEVVSALLPMSSVSRIQGAGHLSPLTHADTVNATIRDFIRHAADSPLDVA